MPRTLLSWDVEELATESATDPFDCVVVGGGSAGLTTAQTLAESVRRVALLEAGPVPFLTNIYNTELRFDRALSDNIRKQVQYGPKLPDGSLFGPNFGCLGGRGLFWNGSSPRFRDHDFDGWPFSAADLAADYEWAEREFRVTLALGESRLAKAIIDKLSAKEFKPVPAPFAADVGPQGPGRLSSGIASGLGIFLRGAAAAISAGSIRVAVGAQVTRVLLSGSKVRGVLATQGADSAKEVRSRSVVLTAGAIESIRLAALSGVPDESGRIGLGIQEHLYYRSYCEGPALYDGKRPENAAVFIPSESQNSEQWEVHAPGRRLFSLDDGTLWQPDAGEAYQVMMRSFAATEKRDENMVEAHEGPPGSATVRFSYSDADKARKESVGEWAARIAEALGLTAVDAQWANPGGSYHEAGGLDMGADPKTSVTDAYGRFHKAPMLVCADAASFPRIGATNPHLTIVAMARRQAAKLAASLA